MLENKTMMHGSGPLPDHNSLDRLARLTRWLVKELGLLDFVGDVRDFRTHPQDSKKTGYWPLGRLVQYGHDAHGHVLEELVIHEVSHAQMFKNYNLITFKKKKDPKTEELVIETLTLHPDRPEWSADPHGEDFQKVMDEITAKYLDRLKSLA